VIRSSRGTTPLRRLLAGVAVALIPVLAGCEAGTNAPTNNPHPASDGAQADLYGIAIRNVFVLGPAPSASLPVGGSTGLFLALVNTGTSPDTLLSISAPGVAASVRLPGGAVSLAQQQPVYLTGPAPQVILGGLTQPLNGGQSIQVTMSFEKAGSITLDVPVLPRADAYATFLPVPSPTPSPTGTTKAAGRHSGSASATPTPSATPTASPSATP